MILILRKHGNKGIGFTLIVTELKIKKTRNKFEKKVYDQLKRAKCLFDYESERIPYVLARHYIPDFILKTNTGTIYIECKGYLRPEDKAKMAAVKRLHPSKDIRILFYRKVQSQIKWAERNGFRFAINKGPRDWLDGF